MRHISAIDARFSAFIVARNRSMPAARASSARRSARNVPTPRCCQLVGDRDRHLGLRAVAHKRAIPTGSPATTRDQHVVVAVDACKAARDRRGIRTFFAPPNRSRRTSGRAGRRPPGSTDGLAAPKRPDRDPPDHFRVHRTRAALRAHGPPRRPRRAIFSDGPSGPLRFLYMDQDIRFLDFEGRRLAYSTYGEGPPLVFGPRWVTPPRRGVGGSTAARVLRGASRERTVSSASTASAAGSPRASSIRGRRSRPSRASSMR